MLQFWGFYLEFERAALCWFGQERCEGSGVVGKAASQTSPSTYQDFWDTSEAMAVPPWATLYRLPQHVVQFWGFWLKIERAASCWFGKERCDGGGVVGEAAS